MSCLFSSKYCTIPTPHPLFHINQNDNSGICNKSGQIDRQLHHHMQTDTVSPLVYPGFRVQSKCLNLRLEIAPLFPSKHKLHCFSRCEIGSITVKQYKQQTSTRFARLGKKKKKKKSQSFLAVLCYHKSSAEIRRRRVYDQNPKLNFPMSQEFLSLKVGTLLSDTEIRALWREPSFLVGVHCCSTWQPESNHKRACHIHEMA